MVVAPFVEPALLAETSAEAVLRGAAHSEDAGNRDVVLGPCRWIRARVGVAAKEPTVAQASEFLVCGRQAVAKLLPD